MLPNGLLLTNKILLVLFTVSIAFNSPDAQSLDPFRVAGWFILPIVLLLTIVAAERGGLGLVRSALVANGIVCLGMIVVFLMAAFGGQLWGGVAMAVVFVPFFFNTYFLARHKPVSVVSSPAINQESHAATLSGFNPFRCSTEVTRITGIGLFIVAVLSWGTWVGVASDGFSMMKPLGWLFLFGVPVAVYVAILAVLPLLQKATKEVRLLLSANLMWAFVVGAWGYMWPWDDVLSLERYVALFVLPLIGIWLGLLLWKWSKQDEHHS